MPRKPAKNAASVSQTVSVSAVPGVKKAPKTASERIQATVRELFYRQGIRAVGVEEIVNTAGVTKPSLYRNFASKDDLTAAYLRQYGEEYVARFEATIAAHPGDARAGVLAWLKGLAQRATTPGYRGCGITNAVVEYPDATHPGHVEAGVHKKILRARLRELAREMGAKKSDVLGDSLLLLMEGCFATGQLFGPGGPAASVEHAAAALITAHTSKN